MDSRIHRVAAAGNAVALTALALLSSQANILFHAWQRVPHATASTATATSVETSERVVLIIVDGLRADTAFDRRMMPRLNEISDSGSRSIAYVQSAIPSSLAGIVALTTGTVSPPGEALFDFKSPPAQSGGILQILAQRGDRSFVAGPTLWTDLYGQWIADSEPDATFGRADERLLQATLRALAAEDHTLVVVHFGQLDAAAHRHGARSPQYRAAAMWCDDAIGQIWERANQRTGFVITSDHGNTLRGGHAGPEPDVLATPLVLVPDHQQKRQRAQTEIPAVIMRMLGQHDSATTAAAAPAANGGRFLHAAALACFATLSGLFVCCGLTRRSEGRQPAFWLHLTVWIVLVLSVAGFSAAASLIALIALAFTALAAGRHTLWPALFLVGGAGVAVLRIVDGYAALASGPAYGRVLAALLLTGWIGFRGAVATVAVLPVLVHRSTTAVRPFDVRRAAVLVFTGSLAYVLGGILLAVVFYLGVFAGTALGRLLVAKPRNAHPWRRFGSFAARPCAVGAMVPAVHVLLSRSLGETISLSTVDVRVAFGAVDLPFGTAVAAVLVTAAQAIPTAGLLIGCSPALWCVTGPRLGAFCTGAYGMLAGQMAIAVLLLSSRAALSPLNSLAVGMLVRSLAESAYLFLGLAALLMLSPNGRSVPRRMFANAAHESGQPQ